MKLITVITLDGCKQSSKENDQIANKFQSDGQPSAQQMMSSEAKTCQCHLPISTNAGIICDLVGINFHLILCNKSVLLAIGSYTSYTIYCLLKMSIDWRTCYRIKTFQLT